MCFDKILAGRNPTCFDKILLAWRNSTCFDKVLAWWNSACFDRVMAKINVFWQDFRRQNLTCFDKILAVWHELMCFCGKKATYSDIFWQVKLDGFRCVRHFLWKTFKLLHVLKYFSNSRLETFEFIKSWQFQHDWHSPFGYKRLCYSHATVGTFILNLLYCLPLRKFAENCL